MKLLLVLCNYCHFVCVVSMAVFMCVCGSDAVRWSVVSHKTSSHSPRTDRAFSHRLRGQRDGARLQQAKKSAQLCFLWNSFDSILL